MDKNMNNKNLSNETAIKDKNSAEQTSYVRDTAGAEMPDPNLDPSKTKFHVNEDDDADEEE